MSDTPAKLTRKKNIPIEIPGSMKYLKKQSLPKGASVMNEGTLMSYWGLIPEFNARGEVKKKNTEILIFLFTFARSLKKMGLAHPDRNREARASRKHSGRSPSRM